MNYTYKLQNSLYVHILIYRYFDSVYDISHHSPWAPVQAPVYDRGHVLPDAHDPQGSYCVPWSVFRMLKNIRGIQAQFLERYHQWEISRILKWRYFTI